MVTGSLQYLFLHQAMVQALETPATPLSDLAHIPDALTEANYNRKDLSTSLSLKAQTFPWLWNPYTRLTLSATSWPRILFLGISLESRIFLNVIVCLRAPLVLPLLLQEAGMNRTMSHGIGWEVDRSQPITSPYSLSTHRESCQGLGIFWILCQFYSNRETFYPLWVFLW